jgi:hypothetical protein
MAKATKSTYKPAKRNNYKPVVTMAEGGNVSELDYSERRAYIEEHYAPFITDAQMIFSIWESGLEYDMKGEWKDVKKEILDHYESISDYTEKTLPEETIYEIKDWDLVRKDIDPETDEVIGETELEELSADNTYNFSYKGLVHLNWRVYYDADYERYFYVIMPHLGGDIRGNYGDAFILEGNDKEELFYRFYQGFVSGGASIYLKFVDGSEVGFDSEQDSDVFNFRLNEVFEPTGMAEKFVSDFEKFDSWYGDEFLKETIDIYLARKGVAPKMMAGGSLNDEIPKAYIQILGDNNEGKWIDLTDYSDGQDVIDNIYDWMNELNKEDGGNREEYEVLDYEGFGRDLYDEYMGANEFEEIIEAYDKYIESDFPNDVISEYKDNLSSGDRTLSDVIEEMDNNYIGTFDDSNDLGYFVVEQGIYTPSIYDVFITDTDKRLLAGDEASIVVSDMRFEDMLNIATNVKKEYNDEFSELEDKINILENEIEDLISLQEDSNEDEYERIAEEIEEKEIERDEIQAELDDIDSRYEDKAHNEAEEVIYDEIKDKLENDLEGWLADYGYDTDNLEEISFLSFDYEKIGEDASNNFLVIEYDRKIYVFNNYGKGGRLSAKKRKPQYKYYIVESSTKKLVSGYETKEQATEQRKLLVKEYPSMRFEIFTLANLERKTDLDVYSKKDYVELSTLDKIKKVSVDAYRYGKEKVGQANAFLEKHDVKGKVKRGARKVWDKTKQGGNWMKRQWQEADFGDGKGKSKFFADGGGVGDSFLHLYKLTYPDGFYIVESYDGEYMSPKEAMEKMRINVKNFKSYKYKGVSSQNPKYKEWNDRKDIGYSNTEAWDEVFENEKYAKGGGVDHQKYRGNIQLQKGDKIKVDHPHIKNLVLIIDEPYGDGYYYISSDSMSQRTWANGGWFDQMIRNPKNELVRKPISGSEELKTKERVKLKYLKTKEIDGLSDEEYNELERLSEKYRFDGYTYADGGGVDFEKIKKADEIYREHNRERIEKGIKEFSQESVDLWNEKYDERLNNLKLTYEEKKQLNPKNWYSEGGSIENEINYIDNRLSNLKEMVYVVNDENKPELYDTIKTLEDERLNLIEKAKNPNKQKKSFFSFFKKGGNIKKDYDVYDNKRMLENQANEVEHHSQELNSQIPLTRQVPAWVISKMERATTDLSDITHYLDGENKMERGGNVGDTNYEIIPLPSSKHFIIVQITNLSEGKIDENVIRDFNGTPLKFEDIKSAQHFIDNMSIEYPYGVSKANMGAILLASQLMQQKQPQQPQVVYYIPQPQEVHSDIIQNVPQAKYGALVDSVLINDFCIKNLVGLANDLQSVKYFFTDRFRQTDAEYQKYKGRLVIIFHEPVNLVVVNSVKEFIERAEDCHSIFEQAVNVSGSEPKTISVNLLTNNFSDEKLEKGGKVYDFPPKKINLEKTKKITTILGDYVLGLVTDDFVYYINPMEGDENAQTIMYNKKGELISDNIHATNDLLENIETNTNFEFIHPNLEEYRKEMISENTDGYKVFNYTDNIYATDEIFQTKSDANKFISEFRKRFEKQGYYRDNQMNQIDPSEIDLLAIPKDFNPYRN